jgi:hypothetical protein
MNRPTTTLNKNLTMHVAIEDAKRNEYKPVGDVATYNRVFAAVQYAIECRRNGHRCDSEFI